MANKKITDLTALTTPDGADLLIIDDVSVTETKKITFANLTSVFATTGSNTYAGNQTVNGFVSASLGFTGSFKGNLDGNASTANTALTASYVLNAVSASFATNALTASYVLNAVSSSFASTALTASYVLNAVSSSFATTASYADFALTASYALTSSLAQSANVLTITSYFTSLNGIANGVATSIGSIYIPAAITISTNSLAYIGGSTASETAILKMVPINTATVSASWSRTNVLGSVALASPVALGVGWYDIILETGSGTQTGFARGLYITT